MPCKKQALISVETLNKEEQSVLHIRAAHEIRSECVPETICTFHKDKYIDAYSSKQKTCCDIFKVQKNLFAIQVCALLVWIDMKNLNLVDLQ